GRHGAPVRPRSAAARRFGAVAHRLRVARGADGLAPHRVGEPPRLRPPPRRAARIGRARSRAARDRRRGAHQVRRPLARTADARGAGPRVARRPGAADPRRADLEPRSGHRRQDARAAARDPPRARPLDPLHLAQHERGRAGVRSRAVPAPGVHRGRGDAPRGLAQRAGERGTRCGRPRAGVPAHLAGGAMGRGRGRRVGALMMRFLLLLRRDPSRVVDTFYWPLIDVVLWGFVTWFVIQRGIELPGALGVFLGAVILWNLFFRVSQDVSVSFLDDIWARSTVTIFASPLTLGEFSAAIMLLGVVKVALSLLAMAGVAWLLYAFDLFGLGFALLPFTANLILLGWSTGLVCMAIILRFGGRWAIVAWSLPVLLMPFSSVFYPESVLPPVARAIATA